jgi:hypothetical protein
MRGRRRPYWTRLTFAVGNILNNPNPTGADFYLNQQLATTYADLADRDIIR